MAFTSFLICKMGIRIHRPKGGPSLGRTRSALAMRDSILRSRYEAAGGTLGPFWPEEHPLMGLAPTPAPPAREPVPNCALGSHAQPRCRSGEAAPLVPHSPCRRGQGPLPLLFPDAPTWGKSVQFHTDACGFPSHTSCQYSESPANRGRGKGVPSQAVQTLHRIAPESQNQAPR